MAAPQPTRRDLEREATRRRILEAATELLLETGPTGFSMRQLAARINYTPTAIYFHFPDKESLLGEVVAGQFMAFREVFEQIGQEPDPIHRLAKMGIAYVEFGLTHPAHYRFMFLTPSLQQIPKERFVEKGNPAQDCYAFLVATVREALEAGRFREELTDAEQIAQLFFASVHGVVALHLIKGDDDWVEWRPVRPRAQHMIAAMIRGLTRAAEQIPSPPEPEPQRRGKKNPVERSNKKKDPVKRSDKR